MATPLLLISNNDTSSDRNNPSQPGSQPDPNPTRPKSRKVTKSGPSGSGGPKKPPQRGMGVAQLERLLRQQQNQQAQVGFQQQLIPSQLHQCPFHQVNPLAGVPVPGPVQPNRLAHYGLPVQRAGPLDADHGYPRMALGYPGRVGQEFNTLPYLADPSFKKKRVMVDDLGFMSGSNFGGYEMNLINNEDNSHYLPINGGTSEVVAIHKKGNGSNMMMMKEYGFFPDKSEANEDNNLSLSIGNTNTNTNNVATSYISSNNNNFNGDYNNQYYNNNNNNNNNNEMDNYMLSLRMRSSDRDHSSSSSISTLSPPAKNNARLDLSLRL